MRLSFPVSRPFFLLAATTALVATGNLLELFSRLVRVGGDPWTYGTLHTPTMVFEGVSFSGA